MVRGIDTFRRYFAEYEVLLLTSTVIKQLRQIDTKMLTKVS